MTGTMYANPNPVSAGDTTTVCYFGFGVHRSITLSFTWYDNTGAVLTGYSIVVTPWQPCVNVVPPADAVQGLVQDRTDGAKDLPITVTG